LVGSVKVTILRGPIQPTMNRVIATNSQLAFFHLIKMFSLDVAA
jgi:hypothetical protein